MLPSHTVIEKRCCGQKLQGFVRQSSKGHFRLMHRFSFPFPSSVSYHKYFSSIVLTKYHVFHSVPSMTLNAKDDCRSLANPAKDVGMRSGLHTFISALLHNNAAGVNGR